jgi:hypothetical protein
MDGIMTYPITHENRAFTPDGEITLPAPSPVLNCGHAPDNHGCSFLPGYALILGSYTVCYACMDEWERSFMADSPAYTGYVEYGPAGVTTRRFTTWTGGTLARITSVSYSRPMWSPHTGTWRHMYVSAVTPDGTRWHGHGSNAKNLITLRRCKTRDGQ